MTQEEKAKTYDEALKRAKAAVDIAADKDLVGGVVRTIFPELCESEDERIRKWLIDYFKEVGNSWIHRDISPKQILAYLEKQKGKMTKDEFENSDLFQLKLKTKYADGYQDGMIQQQEKQKDASKAIEAVERIDKYIDEHLANAHDMKDSNPGKKYYRGWDDALGEMAGILQDVYSGERQKESEDVSASTMIPSCWEVEQKPAESISQLTVQGKGVYKICPRCKERMIRDDSKVYTSMPPQYGYECPKCGEMEFDTVMYDSPVDDRQKEHAPIPDKFSGLKSLMLQYLQSAANRKDDAEIEDDTDLWGRKILDYVWKHTDMQKEQKPAQTVEEKEYIRTLKNLLSAFICDKQPADVVYYQRVYDWLDGRHIEQKPVEWSEEDEKMLENIRYALRYAYFNSVIDEQTTEYVMDWLESLRPQSKQKQNNYITPHKEFFKFIYDRLINVHKENPNVDYMRSFKERLNNLSFGEKQEWSEEDSKRYISIGTTLDTSVVLSKEDYDANMAWLRELVNAKKYSGPRPSWKPSEHQMNILKAVKEYVGKGSGYWGEGLGSLIDDLEKLM